MSGGIVNGSRASGEFSGRGLISKPTVTTSWQGTRQTMSWRNDPFTHADLEAISVDFGGWLGRRLDERGWSYRKAAHFAGVNPSTVLRLRRGDRQPTLATAVRLVGALGR